MPAPPQQDASNASVLMNGDEARPSLRPVRATVLDISIATAPGATTDKPGGKHIVPPGCVTAHYVETHASIF